MKNKLLILAMVVVATVGLSSCGAQQKMHMAQFNSIKIKRAPQQSFYDLDRGVEVKVIPTQPAKANTAIAMLKIKVFLICLSSFLLHLSKTIPALFAADVLSVGGVGLNHFEIIGNSPRTSR